MSRKGKSITRVGTKGEEIRHRSTDQGLQAAPGWQQGIALHLQHPRPVIACYLFVPLTKEGKNIFFELCSVIQARRKVVVNETEQEQHAG